MAASLPIVIDNIRKAYGNFVALDDVSLEIRAGEFLTLLGPSGSGKTTLLMALAGFVRPDSGRLLIGDRDMTGLPPNKRDLGIVFQNYALFPHMTVQANVEYPLRLRSVPRGAIRDRAKAALARVKLDHLGDRPIASLSGGQRQRVALARAFIYEPRVMLMDEPLSALDKNLREQMQFEIRRLHDDLGITTIYVTHDQREALTMSDRIVVMDKGRVQQIGTPTDIYYRPDSRFVAQFMGEANILPVAQLGGPAAERYRTADGQLAMIRAEHFVLDGNGLLENRFEISGRLVARAFRGENWLLSLATAEGEQVMLSIPAARGDACGDLNLGQTVQTYIASNHVHLIRAESLG